MSKRYDIDLPQLAEMPILAVIGLADGKDAKWEWWRAVQYARLARLIPLRAGLGAACAAVLMAIFKTTVPALGLLGWLASLLVCGALVMRVDRGFADLGSRAPTRAEMRRQALFAASTGIIWGAALPLAVILADDPPLAAGWAVLAMMILGAATLLPAAPLGAIAFVVPIGIGAAVGFVLDGTPDLAILVLTYTGFSICAIVVAARTDLVARCAQAGVEEKEEVVSLLLREFEENEADWLWQTDATRHVRNPSPRFAFALGQPAETVEGAPFFQLIAGENWQTGTLPTSLHDLAEKLQRREQFSNFTVEVQIAGEQRWWELSGSPRTAETGAFAGYRGVGSDVTDQRRSSEQIARLARFDTLTGLPNRMMVVEAVGDAMRYAEQWRTRCAFLMIDLDRFKSVNDTLGHQIGDRLLAKVSQRLKQIAADIGVCGRLGGDEFALVIRDAAEGSAVEAIARAVIETLSQPYEVDRHTLYVGASIGSALGPRDGTTVEELMRNADLALYRAKDGGGGAHFGYEPSLHAKAEERRKLEFSLRNALEGGELSLAYQPVVDARSEDVLSFEALLRWNSREHGFVSPVKFIPLAEDTRLIVPIGEWVLREACREALNWPSHIRIAVNVSGEQLLDPSFAGTVVNALASTGLDPRRLEIEVTESIFLRDPTSARASLEQIMSLGCGIALDDFGTGYSSLGYIRSLRFSTIKVDRSFVQGATAGNPESMAIIRAVVAMAQSLDMTTTAEGVEDVDQAQLIRDLGCTKIQGYYFGRPMTPADARQLFDHGGLRETG